MATREDGFGRDGEGLLARRREREREEGGGRTVSFPFEEALASSSSTRSIKSKRRLTCRS